MAYNTNQAGTYSVTGVGRISASQPTSFTGGTLTATDVVLDGVSMKETMAKIQERLCILVPDPALLEKYAALQDLYHQYKMMEALLRE